MKTLLLLSLFLGPGLAIAAPPDCWTTDGSEIGKNAEGLELADGEFLVSVEINRISKDNLVAVLRKMQHGNLNSVLQPTILEEFISFKLETVKGEGEEAPERDALKESINAQMAEILAIPGVSGVECNILTKPGSGPIP